MGCLSCNDGKLQELDSFIQNLPSKDGVLIAVLHKAQEVFGYLPEDVQSHIAGKLEIPAAKVYGVVSFYSFFNTKPRGDFSISVCLGTACFVRGSANILAEFEKELGIKNGGTSADGMFSLNSLRCVGACGLAPVVMVNDRVYGRVKPEDIKRIIDECLAQGGENHE